MKGRMKIMNPAMLALILSLTCSLARGAETTLSADIGTSRSKLPGGASAMSQLQQTGGGPGKVVQGVNLFNGQPYYSIPLGGIMARTVGYPITLTYSGPTKPTAEGDVERAPTSWVGLGFNLSTPFVSINHKGTYDKSDDVVYCNLGPYGGGQLLSDNGLQYFVSNNPYIKVSFDTARSGEYLGQFTSWYFDFPDGKQMCFGMDTNSQRYVLYNRNSIKATPFSSTMPTKFIYRWDLQTFVDVTPGVIRRNVISFEYSRLTTSPSSEKSYVNEAYIHNIKWTIGGREVERYEFKSTWKGTEIPYSPMGEPGDDQKLFETQRLDTLKCFKEGSLTHAYKFDYALQAKLQLSAIRSLYPDPVSGALKQDSGWSFNYDAGRFNLLKTVVTPASRRDSLLYARVDFTSTAGAQDASNYAMLRQDNVTEVPLPSNATERSKWKVENTCDERFCYSVVRDGDAENLAGDVVGGIPFSKKVYVEVKRNLGSYFDPYPTDNGELSTLRLELGDPETTENEWKIMPMGDYLLVVGEAKGTVAVWEYDGIRWISQNVFNGDSHWSSGSFNGRIRVYPSSNYFVVQKIGPPSVLIVALRTGQGWTSMNRSGCDIDDKGYYGEPIRASQTGPECLEWSSQDIVVSTSRQFFTVMNAYNDVFCMYGLIQGGTRFEDLTKKFVHFGISGLQNTVYPMNWEQDVASVTASGDNLFIVSKSPWSPFLTYTWLQAYYFDGNLLIPTMSETFLGVNQTLEVFPSKNYALVAQREANSIFFYPRKNGSDGLPYFSGSNKKTVRTDLNPSWKLLVRTHPKAFSVEYYPDDAGYGLRPVSQASPSNYRSYLYHVSPSLANGFEDRSSQLARNGTNLFNISFSGSDNVLTGTYARNGSSICSENPEVWPCTIEYYSARFHPDDYTTFINGDADKKNLIYNPSWKSPKQAQDVLSNCARVMTRITLDTTGGSGRVRYRHYQYDGKGYAEPDSQFVVTDMISSDALANADRNRIRYHFQYASNGSGSMPIGITEFNSNLQVPQFEFADVKQIKSDGSSLGTTRTVFNLDRYNQNLNGKGTTLAGTEKYTRQMNGSGDTSIYLTTAAVPYHNPAWPSPLYLNRIRSAITQQVARNQSRMADTTYYLGYCDTNGAPRFVLNNNRPRKITMTQNVYDAYGNATQSLSYKLTGQPDTGALRTWPNAQIYSNNPIAASKIIYSGHTLVGDSVWLEKDQTLTDADLRNGKTPLFNWAEGWFPSTSVTQFKFGQVVESKVVKNAASGPAGESYTSAFYEGLRSDPVALVRDAKLSDCAVLMGENMNTDLQPGYLDYNGRWQAGGAVFSNDRSHTGRYSLKVVDNWGPAVNLSLQDVRALGYDFKISAWVYSDSGTPVINLGRYQSGGGYLDGVSASPVSGSPNARKVWQRWEAKLSNAQLIAGNKFNGSSDYLRMYFGLGAPTGNSARVVYVDDIVCVPSTADFNLTTYDKSGTTTSITGGNFLPTYYDIGLKGNVIAVRDDKYRIFSQSAMHKMGEN